MTVSVKVNFMLHQLTENTKLLQKALLIADGKVLVLKRADDSFSRPGKWDLPGGNSEWPDSIDDLKNPHELDLLREIREETGLEVGRYWHDRHRPLYFTTYFEAERQVFSVIVIWRVDLPKILMNGVKISHEHQQFRWVSSADVLKHDLGFAGQKGGFVYEAIRSL